MTLDSLMKKWWDNPNMYEKPYYKACENENGEYVILTITKDCFKTETAQKNDWVRENHWYRDGSSTETYKK